MRYISIILLASCFSFVTLAQSAKQQTPQKNNPSTASPKKTQKSKPEASAMAQYIEGTAVKKLDKLKKQVVYTTLLTEGEVLSISSDSYGKFVNRGLCKMVFYENSKVKVPGLRANWRLGKNTNARFICPDGKSITFKRKDIDVEVKGGEALYLNGKVLALKGTVTANNQKLEELKLYEFNNGKASIDEEDQEDLWKLDQKFKKPKESHVWKAKKKESTTLWIAGVAVGGGSFHHNQGEMPVDILSTDDIDVDGATLTTIFPFKGYEVIASISPSEANLSDGHCNNYNWYGCNRYHLNLAEVGLRFKHRIANYFFQVGIGTANYHLNMIYDSSSFGFFQTYDRDLPFTLASISLGIDKVIDINNWLAFYGGAKFTFFETLSYNGGGEVFDQPYPVEFANTLRDGFEGYSGQVILGLAIKY